MLTKQLREMERQASVLEQSIFSSIRLIQPNGLGGHNIFPSSKSGFSTKEYHKIWNWFKENNGAQAIHWDKVKKCLVTMSVKNK